MLNPWIAFRVRLYILPSYFNYYQDSQKILACSRLQDSSVPRNETRVGTTTHFLRSHASYFRLHWLVLFSPRCPRLSEGLTQAEKCKPVDVSDLEQVVCTVIKLSHLFYCIFLFSSCIFNLFFLPFFLKGKWRVISCLFAFSFLVELPVDI